MSTLVDLLRLRAQEQPDQRAFTFLHDGETEKDHLTYAQLDRRARAVAAQLQAITQSGQRAVLLYPPGLDFIIAFFGCLYAGVVAVPAYPPNPARLERGLPRLRAIMGNARPRIVLTISPFASMVNGLASLEPGLQQLHVLATDTPAGDAAGDWSAAPITADTLAFLQYTSGSTATPKGVMLSHRNLLHNQQLIQRGFGHDQSTRVVGWTPLYHDTGLIGTVLQPLYLGVPCILMSPVAFLQSPIRWLQAITRYGGTSSGGPNFAYDLCVLRTTSEQRATLDLSSWRVAFNGAEPVRPHTLEAFSRAFEPYGFRREAFYPCYGLAESALFVTGGQAADRPTIRDFERSALAHNRAVAGSGDSSQPLVGCGHQWLDQQIVAVDPTSFHASEPGRIGELWVAGPSVAQGYWDLPEETQRSFRAYRADTGEGPYLAHRRSGLLSRRRAVRHRPPQRPDHCSRTQPLSTRHRADGRAQPCCLATRLRRGVLGRPRWRRAPGSRTRARAATPQNRRRTGVHGDPRRGSRAA